MKRLRLFCLVLCVSLLLLTAFSVTANAETITNFQIRQDVYLIDKDGDIAWEYFEEFTPNNSSQEKWQNECDYYEVRDINLMQLKHRTVWNIFSPKTGYPFVLNKVNRISLENFYYRYLLDDIRLHYVRDYNDIYVILTYADNSTERIEVEVYADTDLGLDINFDITPTKNVSRVDLYVDSNVYEQMPSGYDYQPVTITSYFGEYNGDNKYNFNIEIQSEEAGLLSGILGWIQNIFNKIGDTFDKVVAIFDTVVEAVKELKNLPARIWGLIQDGLQALFIPSDAYMTAFNEAMQEMLLTKLGAVMQVIELMDGMWESITESDDTNTINIPSVTIDLPDNNEFTFGGYNVLIVPDGFEFLVEILKYTIGIVATLACFNGLRKRANEFLGGANE